MLVFEVIVFTKFLSVDIALKFRLQKNKLVNLKNYHMIHLLQRQTLTFWPAQNTDVLQQFQKHSLIQLQLQTSRQADRTMNGWPDGIGFCLTYY